MKVSRKSAAKHFENSPTCVGVNYLDTGPDINGAVISVKGRYPSTGFLTNDVCKELVYVLNGSGEISLRDGVSRAFQAGDVVYVNSGDVFAWQGDFEGFFATTPIFDPSQHREIRE